MQMLPARVPLASVALAAPSGWRIWAAYRPAPGTSDSDARAPEPIMATKAGGVSGATESAASGAPCGGRSDQSSEAAALVAEGAANGRGGDAGAVQGSAPPGAGESRAQPRRLARLRLRDEVIGPARRLYERRR